MKSTREDRVTATECLFDAGGELRGVAHARERIVAAIERARADGAAAALTDPRLVLDAAEKLLRPPMKHGWSLQFGTAYGINGIDVKASVQFWLFAGEGTDLVEANDLHSALEKLKEAIRG